MLEQKDLYQFHALVILQLYRLVFHVMNNATIDLLCTLMTID